MPIYAYASIVYVRAGNQEEATERLDEARGVVKRLTTAELRPLRFAIEVQEIPEDPNKERDGL